MAQIIDIKSSQEAKVETHRNWGGIFMSSLVGGAVAVVAAPILFALAPAGLAGLTIASVTTGILSSSTTRVLDNAMGASRVSLVVRQHPVQQFYRKTVLSYVGTDLDGVISAARMNRLYQLRNRVFFDIDGAFSLQGSDARVDRRMFFDFSFRVVPPNGTELRRFEDGVAPLDFPEYDQDSTRTTTNGDRKELLDGLPYAIAQGALFGVVGGVIAEVAQSGAIMTVYDKIGVALHMPSAATSIAGPLCKLRFPSNDPIQAVLFIEFVTEVQRHVNRLGRCAADNGVGLELSMKIGSTSDLEANVTDSTASGNQKCSLHWSTELKIDHS